MPSRSLPGTISASRATLRILFLRRLFVVQRFMSMDMSTLLCALCCLISFRLTRLDLLMYLFPMERRLLLGIEPHPLPLVPMEAQSGAKTVPRAQASAPKTSSASWPSQPAKKKSSSRSETLERRGSSPTAPVPGRATLKSPLMVVSARSRSRWEIEVLSEALLLLICLRRDTSTLTLWLLDFKCLAWFKAVCILS